MTRPAIAAIVTCFDLGRTLDETLRSIAAQTLPPVDIVIVDDGSTDLLTRQVLARQEAVGIRVLRTENHGVSAARNAGIRSTSAPLIVLVDADDILEPGYFAKASARLEARPELSFVSCAMRSFGGTNDVWAPPAPELVRSLTFGVPHVSSMFRRVMWEEIGGFDESFRAHEEVDFWATALERGFRGEVLDEPLLRYRVRPGSLYQSAIHRDRHLQLMERFYDKHSAALTERAESLVVEKERFIINQRLHRDQLTQRRQTLGAELHVLQDEIAATVTELQAVNLGRVDFGDFRRVTPVSPFWGLDRGTPLDRYYINRFVAQNRLDIRGRVLEVKDSGYTKAFGDERVTTAEALDIDPTNPHATVIADLTRADGIPSDSFDCFILTQTLGLIYDVSGALRHACRILKPGGVLLCTVPAAGRISYEEGLDGDYWRFTEASIRRLFADAFPPDAFEVRGHGNVLAGAAFLYGLALEELTPQELDVVDPFFPLVYTIRAVKPARLETPPRHVALVRNAAPAAAVLMYHRVADRAEDTHNLCVPPDEFQGHLRHLRVAGYRVLPLQELVDAAAAGTIDEPVVSLTFDDGYLDSLTHAAPILREFGFPATFFVVSGALDPAFEFWWDALDRVFGTERQLPTTLELLPPAVPLRFVLSDRRARQVAHDSIKEHFYRLDHRTRVATLEALRSWSGPVAVVADCDRAMYAEEVGRLARMPGMSIGAHSVHHLLLPTLSSSTKQAEIRGAKAHLEAIVGRDVTSFSYPYGGQDPETVHMVRDAGYSLAVTTEEARVGDVGAPFLIPRFEIRKGGVQAFTARLEGIFG